MTNQAYVAKLFENLSSPNPLFQTQKAAEPSYFENLFKQSVNQQKTYAIFGLNPIALYLGGALISGMENESSANRPDLTFNSSETAPQESFSTASNDAENRNPLEQIKPLEQKDPTRLDGGDLKAALDRVPNTVLPFLVPPQIQSGPKVELDLDFLVSEIVDQIRVIKEKSRTSVLLSLKPEHLGNALLNITAKDGVITIGIVAEPKTKELIEEKLAQLTAAIKDANLNLGGVSVGVGDFGQRSGFTSSAPFEFSDARSVNEQNIFMRPFSAQSILEMLGLLGASSITFEV